MGVSPYTVEAMHAQARRLLEVSLYHVVDAVTAQVVPYAAMERASPTKMCSQHLVHAGIVFV